VLQVPQVSIAAASGEESRRSSDCWEVFTAGWSIWCSLRWSANYSLLTSSNVCILVQAFDQIADIVAAVYLELFVVKNRSW